MSLSPGAIGEFGANHHLCQSQLCLNMLVLQQPEATSAVRRACLA
jgi:chromate reductase, NAD(P)H dehydrogenase (quinone)